MMSQGEKPAVVTFIIIIERKGQNIYHVTKILSNGRRSCHIQIIIVALSIHAHGRIFSTHLASPLKIQFRLHLVCTVMGYLVITNTENSLKEQIIKLEQWTFRHKPGIMNHFFRHINIPKTIQRIDIAITLDDEILQS